MRPWVWINGQLGIVKGRFLTLLLVSEKPFKTFFNNLFPKRRPSRPTSFSVLNATHSPGADSPDMTVQDPRATPSPPSTVPSPNDTTESNASDVSEVEELAPKKTHATVARGSVSESESAKTRAVKHDIADSTICKAAVDEDCVG